MARGTLLGLLALLVLSGGDAHAKGRAQGHLAAPPAFAGVVNLNTATAEQLDLLPGVGPKVAQAILTYRARQPFRRVEELVRIKGLGRKRVLALRPLLAVSGDTTLHRLAPVAQAAPGREVGPR